MQKIEKLLKKHQELSKLAKFTVDEDNEIIWQPIIDFKDFDISFEDYFFKINNPKDEFAGFIDKFYEDLYKLANAWCNENPEYTIDCFQDRYTVRKKSEIEQFHYNALSEEEKKAFDENKLQAKINEKRAERDNILNTVVDPVVTNPLRWEELDEAQKSKYRAYRLYLLDIPQQEEFPDIEIKSFEEFLK